VLVQPDVRFCHLGQVLRIGTVAHDTKVLVRAARIGAGPPDDGLIVPERSSPVP
jgi:hypothetical protein